MEKRTHVELWNQKYFNAFEYAKAESACIKIAVGSIFIPNEFNESKTYKGIHASNSNPEGYSCQDHGNCFKALKTGVYESVEWTRQYCKSVHSEINLIGKLKEIYPEKSDSELLSDGTVVCTRYMCENCATNLVRYGVTRVEYCGRQEISDTVKEIFKDVDVVWNPRIDFEYTPENEKFWDIFDIRDRQKLQEYLEYVKNVYRCSWNGKEIYERHHIVPSCLGTNYDVGIPVKPRDHFIMHRMLIGIFNGIYNSKLSFAYMRMATSTNRQKSSYEVTPEEYEEACEMYAKSYKEHIAIYGHPMKGKTLTDKQRNRISDTHPDFTGENNPFFGKKHSKETKNKMKKSASERDKSSYNTDNMMKSLKGNKNAVGRWMNNGFKSIKVKKSEVDLYISNGWKIGRIVPKRKEGGSN